MKYVHGFRFPCFVVVTGLVPNPDCKIHGATLWPTWGRQDPGGPHVGHMNLAIWKWIHVLSYLCISFRTATPARGILLRMTIKSTRKKPTKLCLIKHECVYNSCHFADDIFKHICHNESGRILIQILNFRQHRFRWWRWPSSVTPFNTLRPRQNGRHFADDTFKRIFLNENVRISIKISLKFVPKAPINNNPTLVQIMAWRRSGDKPLSQPMMVSLMTHICVTRPQWVKDARPLRVIMFMIFPVTKIWNL